MAASVTTMDGMRSQATQQAVDGANRRAGGEGAAITTAGIGAPAVASVPATTLHTANVDPTEMSISPVRIDERRADRGNEHRQVREDQVGEVRRLEEPGRRRRPARPRAQE